MAPGGFRFEGFELDPADRRLRRDGAAIDLNGRYLDALVLLVRARGRLVAKDRFLAEVWRGVPVTDEALTQCIRTLRRALGDDAARPRFIETVPKHGYRFVAAVEAVAPDAPGAAAAPAPGVAGPRLAAVAAAGALGGGAAGVVGGLLYGFALDAERLPAGAGAASVLLVLVGLCALVGVLGGAGVAAGIGAARRAAPRPAWWALAGGGAIGGLLVGAFAKLLGSDAVMLLFGRGPGDITGAPEGALLGAGVGLGGWLAARLAARGRLRACLAGASVAAAAGLLIPRLGGRLMGGSLDALSRQFPSSRLRLDQIGARLGEEGFGPTTQAVTGALEGLLFGGGVIAALLWVERGRAPRERR